MIRSVRQPHSSSSFSLLELLVVIAVISIMAALVAPSLSGFINPVGRKGAVYILMGVLEQARAAALESGQTVYVGFADADFPVEDMRFSAFVVFRDATEEEAGKSFVALKKWTRLPKNVAFVPANNTLVGADAPRRKFDGLKSELGSAVAAEEFPYVAFNSSGAIEQPATKLKLFLQDARRENGSEKALCEQISLSRYTGRAQVDVTTPES